MTEDTTVKTTAEMLNKLTRSLLALGYHPGIAWWITQYIQEYATLSGCPWLQAEHAREAHAIIGQRFDAGFRPDPLAFALWRADAGITDLAAN